MRDRRKIISIALIGLAIALCAILPAMILMDDLTYAGPLDESDPFTFAYGFALAAGFSLFIAYAFIVYAAFEYDTKWMLGVLIMPPVSFAFIALHRDRARPAVPFLCLGLLFWLASHILA